MDMGIVKMDMAHMSEVKKGTLNYVRDLCFFLVCVVAYGAW